MGSASNSLETTLLKTVLTANTYTGPSNVYVSLYSVAPTESTSGTELTGNGYSRQISTFSVSNNIASSTANVTFSATGNSWTVVAMGLMDASTSGNLLFYDTLATQQTVQAGANLIFGTGNITVECD